MKRIIAVIIIIGVSTGLFLGRKSNPASGFGAYLNLPPPAPTTIITPPSKLNIPKINVAADVETVGLDEQKRMDVPKSWFNVGWYQLGPKPGEKGSAVIAGHLDTPTGAAVFWQLNQLEPGDRVEVVDQSGKTHVFTVTQITAYPDSEFPIETVFGNSNESRLNLITCQGAYNPNTNNYSERLVVFTVLSH